MPFNIIRDDITRLETDAIVNAANSRLLAGGGVCGAIFSAAGVDDLQEACNKIGHCNVGEAVITKGFNLKAKYVIHTVGPVYGEDPVNEEYQLYSCYKNSLELAKVKKLESIAFPVISSGIYGYPKTEAIKIATTAIRDFLSSNEMEVYLVVYDRSAFEISEKLFDDVRSYIEERMVKLEDERRQRFDDCCYSGSIAGGFSRAARDFKNLSCPDEDIAEYATCDAAPPKNNLKPKKSLEDLLGVKTETFSDT